jgi:hypothetical protein
MLKTIRVDLPEEGIGVYVDIRSPLGLRWKEQKALAKREDEDDIAYSCRLLRTLVVGGNLTAEDGRLLTYPLTDADIDELTNYTIAQIMTAYKEEADKIAPKN